MDDRAKKADLSQMISLNFLSGSGQASTSSAKKRKEPIDRY